jgi:hypothetical protein
MRIAILGAGIYGLTTAIELTKNKNIESIDVFEAKDDILLGASSNNHHRLHSGFHYPRSKETIQEIIKTHLLFVEEFSDCVVNGNNYYLIHQDSYVNFEEYVEIYQNYKVPFKKVKIGDKSFNERVDFIQGIIKTKESIIDLVALRNAIIGRIRKGNRITIHLNMRVNEVLLADYLEKYDWVINTTYGELNTPPMYSLFDLKYELNILPVVLLPKLPKYTCLTIMDGPYGSIYSNARGLHVLYGVTTSPITYSLQSEQINDEIKNIRTNKKYIREKIKGVVEDLENYFPKSMEKYEMKSIYLTKKTKMREDYLELRVSSIKKRNNLISVLSGKIGSCIYIAREIVKLIEEG